MIPNHLGRGTQGEESQLSYEETSETPQGNLLQGGSQGSGSRIDRMEQIMENMLMIMQ